MKKQSMARILSLVTLFALCAVLCMNICLAEAVPEPEEIHLGEGQTAFAFVVTFADGQTQNYVIHTDKTIVGEALQELALIDGEEGPYGLYVKTVASVTYDYDKDHKYWAFYVNGEYAMNGVDKTEIDETAVYMLKAE